MSVTNREITTTRAAQNLPTIWASDTQRAIKHEMLLAKLVNTRFESQMRIGRVLRIPSRSNLNTQTKTEGLSDTVNFQAVTENGQDVTISTYEYAAQLLNEVVSKQSKYNERKEIADALGYSLGRGMEVTIAGLFGSFSQIVGTLGADPDDAVIRRSWQHLDAASVRDDSAWVFGSAATAALFGNDKYTSRDFVDGKSVIESARLPELYGYPVFRSNLLTVPATGQTNCALFNRKAIILIAQIKPTVKEHYLIQHFADGITALQLYTADEAEWVDEAPNTDSPGTIGDFGAVLIRTS